MLSTVKFAFMVVSVNKANCEVLSIGFGQCTYETPKLCQKIVVPGYSHCQEYTCPHSWPPFRGL